MNSTTGPTQGKVIRRAIRMARVITPVRLLRGLAMGGLLVATTALFFNMAAGHEAGRPSSSHQTAEAVPASTSLESGKRETEPARPLSRADLFNYPDDAWIYGSPYYEDFSTGIKTAPGPNRDLSIIPDDEWIYGSPYLDDFSLDEGVKASP